MVNAEVEKCLFNSCAHRNANKADFLFGVLFVLFGYNLFVVLIAHIVDFNVDKLSQTERLADNKVRRVGVDMHLNHVVVIYNEHTVAVVLYCRFKLEYINVFRLFVNQ